MHVIFYQISKKINKFNIPNKKYVNFVKVYKFSKIKK